MKLLKVLTLAAALTVTGVVLAPPALFAASDSPTEAVVTTTIETESGQGFWGCSACVAGAGLVVSGGWVAVYAFLESPIAPLIVGSCGAACFG